MSIGIVRHRKSEFTDAGVFAPVWWKKSPLKVCSTCRDHVPFPVTFQVEAMYHWGPCWDSQLLIATWMAAVARYRLDSTAEHLEHLIAPLLKAGWKVDDFYLYDGNLGGNAAWQPKAATFEPDPTLSKVERQDLDAAIAIAKKLKTFGADVVCSKVFNHYDTSADDRSFINGSDLVTPTAVFFEKPWAICSSQFCSHAQRDQHVVATSWSTKKKGAGFQYSYVMYRHVHLRWCLQVEGLRFGCCKSLAPSLCSRGWPHVFLGDAASMKWNIHPGIDYVFLADPAANILGNVCKYLVWPGDMGTLGYNIWSAQDPTTVNCPTGSLPTSPIQKSLKYQPGWFQCNELAACSWPSKGRFWSQTCALICHVETQQRLEVQVKTRNLRVPLKLFQLFPWNGVGHGRPRTEKGSWMMLNVCVLLEIPMNFHVPARSGRVSELGRVDAGQGAMQSQSRLDGMQSYH